VSYSVQLDEIARDEWCGIAAGFADYNYCQTWDYAALRAQETGSRSSHAVVRDGNNVVALVECRVKEVPVLGGGIAYASGGPLWRRGGAEEEGNLTAILAALREAYVRELGLLLRLEPYVPADRTEATVAAFGEGGYAAVTPEDPYRTLVLDLRPDLEQLRKGLRQKWRNCLNKSEKQGLESRCGCDMALFDEFAALYEELVARKGFKDSLGADFYRRVQEALPDAEKFLVMLACDGSGPVAGHVASMLGDTCVYLLGASNEKGLKSNASYLLQWAVCQEAKERGIARYDLGGIDPDGNPGVYRFKNGLSGEEVTNPGPFEAAPGWAKRAVVRTVETLYRKLRGR